MKMDHALFCTVDFRWNVNAFGQFLVYWRTVLKSGIEIRIAEIQKPLAQRNADLCAAECVGATLQ